MVHHLSILCGSGTLDEVNYVLLVALTASSATFSTPSTCLDISRGLDLLSRFEPDVFTLYDTSLGSTCVLSPQLTLLSEPSTIARTHTHIHRHTHTHSLPSSSLPLSPPSQLSSRIVDDAIGELNSIRNAFPFSSFVTRLRLSFFTMFTARSSDRLAGLLSFLREADSLRSGRLPSSRFFKALSAYAGAVGGNLGVPTGTLFSRPNVLTLRLFYGKDSAFLVSSSGYIADRVDGEVPFLPSASKARLVHDALWNLYCSITAHFSRLLIDHEGRFAPFEVPATRQNYVSNNTHTGYRKTGFPLVSDVPFRIAIGETTSLSAISEDDFLSLVLQYSHVIPDSVYFDCAVQDASEIEYVRFLDDLLWFSSDSATVPKHVHYSSNRKGSEEEYTNESLRGDLTHTYNTGVNFTALEDTVGYRGREEDKEQFLSQTLQLISDMFTSGEGGYHPRSYTSQHGVVYGDPACPSPGKLRDILALPTIRDRLRHARSYVLQSILSGSVARSFQFQPSDFRKGDALCHGLVRSSFFQNTLQRLLEHTVSTACVMIASYIYACFTRRDVALDCFSQLPWEEDQEYPKGPYTGHWVDYEAFLRDIRQLRDFRNLETKKQIDMTPIDSVAIFPVGTKDVFNTSWSHSLQKPLTRQVTQNDIQAILRTLSSDLLSSHTTLSYLESLLRLSDTLHQLVIPFSRLQHTIESCLPPPVSLVYERNGSWDMVRTWYAIPGQHPGLDIGATLVDYPTFMADLKLAQNMF